MDSEDDEVTYKRGPGIHYGAINPDDIEQKDSVKAGIASGNINALPGSEIPKKIQQCLTKNTFLFKLNLLRKQQPNQINLKKNF